MPTTARPVRGGDRRPAPPPGRSRSGAAGRPRSTGSPSRPSRRPASPRRAGPARSPLWAAAPRWAPATTVVLGPGVAALIGEVAGDYSGPGFLVVTVLTACLAAAAAGSDGLWWVLTSVPAVILLVAVVTELEWHDPAYADSKAKAVGLTRATTHAFPVIVVAELAMLVIVVLGTVRARRAGGSDV